MVPLFLVKYRGYKLPVLYYKLFYIENFRIMRGSIIPLDCDPLSIVFFIGSDSSLPTEVFS